MKNDILIDAIGMICDETIAEAKTFEKKSKKPKFKSIASIAVAVIICITTAIPVLAFNDVEPAYELINSISPELAKKLKPVKKSCIDNGIKMEVVSAYVYDDTAEILVTMTDLEENRIDETIDLFDSYGIDTPNDSSASCNFISYDDKEQSATFLIKIKNMDKAKIERKRIKFSVKEFLSHKTMYEDEIPGIDLESVSTNPPTQSNVNGRGEGIPSDELFLKPNSKPLAAPTDGVDITAIGYLDGKLRVQVYYKDILKTDNHGWLYLKDANGKLVEFDDSVTFWDDACCGSYQEYIIGVPYNELENYKLYGDFTTCNQLTKGNWNISFYLKDVK